MGIGCCAAGLKPCDDVVVVVRANLDSEANRRLVEDYIRNLGTVGAEGGRA